MALHDSTSWLKVGGAAGLCSEQCAHLHDSRLLQCVHLDSHSSLFPLLGQLCETDQSVQAAALWLLPAHAGSHDWMLCLRGLLDCCNLLLAFLQLLHGPL